MVRIGRKWRKRVALGLIATPLLVVLALRESSGPPAVSSPPPPVRPVPSRPVLDLDRLYTVDYLVLVGDPPGLLRLDSIGPVGGSQLAWVSSSQVPEPAAGALWILGFAALYTLYLPARTW